MAAPAGGRALRTAGLLFLVGELHHASGTFAIDFGMAPEHAQGQYMGLAGLGIGAAGAFAPVFMLGLCLTFGTAGWLGLGDQQWLAGPHLGRPARG